MTLQDKKDNLEHLAKAWYLGIDNDESISDMMFDDLENEILKEDPNYNYRSTIESQGDTRTHYFSMNKVRKVQEKEKSMQEVYDEAKLSDEETAPKYDGSGLALYYNNGKLYDALTRSSQATGKRQLEKILSMVPNTLKNKDIVAIECEVVVDLVHGLGDSSRSKANGLVNSNSMQQECEELLTVIGFKLRYKQGKEPESILQMLKDLQDIPSVKVGSNYTYVSTPVNTGEYKGNKYTGTTKDGIVVQALIDGIVSYFNVDSKSYNKYLDKKWIKPGMDSIAQKIYFNEKKESTITDIEWNLHQSSLKYVPKYIYDTVIVDGTNCSRANVGGTAQLKSMQCGIGAKVEVIKAGLTIPQVFRPVSDKISFETELYTFDFSDIPQSELDTIKSAWSSNIDDIKRTKIRDRVYIKFNNMNKYDLDKFISYISEHFDKLKFKSLEIKPTLNTSNQFNLPFKCGCGSTIGIEHELNGGLYCPNTLCSVNKQKILDIIDSRNQTIQEFIIEDPVKFVASVLKVPRFNGEKLLKYDKNKFISSFVDKKGKTSNVYDKYTLQEYAQEVIDTKETLNTTIKYFNLTGLQLKVLEKFNVLVDTLI